MGQKLRSILRNKENVKIWAKQIGHLILLYMWFDRFWSVETTEYWSIMVVLFFVDGILAELRYRITNVTTVQNNPVET